LLFSFNLTNCKITDTRSAHKDTDYASLTLRVGSATPNTLTLPMGDLNNGTFNLGLIFNGVDIEPNNTVTINYLIINAGTKSAATVKAGLEALGNRMTEVVGVTLPKLTSSLEVVATTFADELSSLLNRASCDGLVAAEQNSFTYQDLVNGTSSTAFFTQSTPHTGYKANSGCNSKPSAYVVNWAIEHVAAVPSVYRQNVGQVGAAGSALDVLHLAGLFGQVISKANSPSAEVTGQEPPAGTFATYGSGVQLTTITAP
jgi:hypothetical protein